MDFYASLTTKGTEWDENLLRNAQTHSNPTIKVRKTQIKVVHRHANLERQSHCFQEGGGQSMHYLTDIRGVYAQQDWIRLPNWSHWQKALSSFKKLKKRNTLLKAKGIKVTQAHCSSNMACLKTRHIYPHCKNHL